jgi:hypothetical protein
MKTIMKTGALSLALGAASASAVELGQGEGQVLLFPYYTVNNGHSTVLQVSNGRDEAKALRLRIVEGSNGRNVLDFNIYLRPFETFAVAVVADAEGHAQLRAASQACTAPTIPAQGVELRPFDYSFDRNDGGSQSLQRAREGHVEIFEMGVVTSGLVSAINGNTCAPLSAAWLAGGVWATNPSSGLVAPTGGLSGSASVVDVTQGVLYAVPALAIDRFSGIVQHAAPGSGMPSLATAAGATAEADVQARWQVPGLGWVQASWPRSQAIDAVSAVLAQTEVSNSFNVGSSLGADTEWVLSFPTKAFYTDNTDTGPVDGAALAPFSGGFLANNPQHSSAVRGGACSFLDIEVTDRSGAPNNQLDGVPCSPEAPNCGPVRVAACHTTQVLSFGAAAVADQPSPLLGSLRQSAVAYGLGTLEAPLDVSPRSLAAAGDIDAGRASLRLPGVLRPSKEGIVVRGLPVIAFSFERVINSNAQPGRVANYGGALPHSGQRDVSIPTEPDGAPAALR